MEPTNSGKELPEGLRTYHDDVAKFLKRKQDEAAAATKPRVTAPIEKTLEVKGTDRIIIEDPNESADASKRKIVFVAIGFVLLIGLAALGYFFIIAKKSSVTVQPIAVSKTLIASESNVNVVETTGETPLQAFIGARSSLTGSDNAVVAVNITSASSAKDTTGTLVNGPTFAAALSQNIPADLVLSLNNTFMAGYHLHGLWQPFVIFKVDSYENAYAGMLAWEKTMAADLATFTGNTTIASSTFQDILLRNKDARKLVDGTGATILVYSLPDSQTVVITTDEATLDEILGRLNASQFNNHASQ